MKKNEQLFDIIGDIPDNLIEDAQVSSVVKSKSLNWKSLVAVAAGFAVVFSVPAAVVIMNKNIENNNITPNISVSETAPATTVSEDTSLENTEGKKSDISENALSFGTGPERAENYSADKMYSYCDIKSFDFYNADNLEASYIENVLNTILLNKELAEQIISDVNTESEKIAKGNGILADNGDITCDITEIINGYASINIMAYTDSGLQTTNMIYDIIEGRILENESDLFYYGEDYVKELDNCISEYLCISDFIVDKSKSYKIKLNGLYIYGTYGGVDDSINSNYYYFPFAETQSVYDIVVTGKYRDMSGVIKDEYLSNKEMEEWYSSSISRNMNGYNVRYRVLSSRFHSEEEIETENTGLIDMYQSVLDYISGTGLKLENSVIDLSDYYLNEKLCGINVNADNYSASYFFEEDGTSGRIIDGNLFCSEWKNYIDSYYDNPYNGDYNPLDKRIEENKVNIDDFKLIDWSWKNNYYIRDDDLDEGNNVRLSDDEIESLDKAAFVFNLYNPDTEEMITALVLIPIDKIYNVYFNAMFGKDGYANRVRQWDR